MFLPAEKTAGCLLPYLSRIYTEAPLPLPFLSVFFACQKFSEGWTPPPDENSWIRAWLTIRCTSIVFYKLIQSIQLYNTPLCVIFFTSVRDCIWRSSDRSLMFIICTVQIVWIKPKIQPILYYILSSGGFHACHLKINGGGGGGVGLGSTTCRDRVLPLGGVYGLDLARVDSICGENSYKTKNKTII